MQRRAIFLDRDGVLNRAIVRSGMPFPPSTVAEIEILAGVPEALHRLKTAGFVLIVVSNQPDVARGTTTREAVEAINGFLAGRLPIDRFLTCYDDGENADCRKPRPGMLLAGAAEFDVDLSASYMIGDRWRDIDAGIAAGCKTVFIDYGYAERKPAQWDVSASSLFDAVPKILRESICGSHA